MNKYRKYLTTALLAVVLVLTAATDAFARGGFRGGGGFRSGGGFGRSSSSSFGRSSTRSTPRVTRSTSTWGKSTPKATNTRSTTPTKPTISAADKALAAKAKANGTSFNNRSAAVTDFKTKNATKYTSTYATQPSTRPAHIPQTYSSGGSTYNVTYNRDYGGYGYMGPSGRWVMYDAMADAAMISLLMRNNNYYYPATTTAARPVAVHTNSGWSVLTWIGVFVFAGVFIFFIFAFINS